MKFTVVYTGTQLCGPGLPENVVQGSMFDIEATDAYHALCRACNMLDEDITEAAWDKFSMEVV